VVTRHGRPVARLVPVAPAGVPGFIGSMRGSLLGYERPFDAIPGTWLMDAAPRDRE
jgi:antitoxin (DNA-binding transcriptional repressor) of toxin-antitoxin stability system